MGNVARVARRVHYCGMASRTTERERPWVPQADSFGARLALVRQAMDWNQRRASEQCGFSPRMWATWEDGSEPQRREAVCQAISERTGVDYIWLMTGRVSQDGGAIMVP